MPRNAIRIHLGAATSPLGDLALVIYRDRRWEYVLHTDLGEA